MKSEAVAMTKLVILGIASLVFLAGCGSGTSQSLNNQPPNPTPAITTISPTSAVATGAAFTLTVNGTNFVASSVVNFAGVARTTTFVSATQLTAAIPAAAIATAVTAAVTVTNPSPGGGTSNAVNFTIAATNPTPTITTISPTSAVVTGGPFTLTVNGTNFLANSVVNFAGVAPTITGVSATQLIAAIPAAAIATAGTATVTVANPAPGGGTSNAVNFTITALPGPPWVSTGTMSFQRFGHTATLLVDGQVLVAGGAWNGAAPCEIYNPSTHGWTTTGTMNTSARALHTATLLQNGKVLVAGGSDSFPGFNITATAELFDPSTGAWTSTAPMNHSRAYHAATMLADGRVLVSGGVGDQTAEIYDPTTGTWTSTPNMQYMRVSHTSTLLPNGRVLVAQGGSTVAEEYDPTTGAWSSAGTVPTFGSPSDLTATLLLDGTVLTAGGCAGFQADFCLGTMYADADSFTPATLAWAATSQFMSTTRTQHTATLLGDGKVLVAGSQEAGVVFSDNFQLSSAELYDPATSSWSAASPMIVGRSRHTATLLNDKTVLVVGGVTDIYCDDVYCNVKTVASSAELFTP